MKKGLILTSIFVVMALTISFSSVAEGKPFTKSAVSVSAPTQGLPTDLGGLIEQIFTWALAVLGIAVFVMVFYAGFLWLTAAGNTAKVGEARSRITNAVFGAIILLSAYLILYTINPNFIKNTFDLKGLGPQSTLDPALEKDEEDSCIGEEIPTASLRADLDAERAKYGAELSHDEAGKLLNAVAWKNKGAGWGLLEKIGGNRCDQPGGTSISCDWLVHEPSGLGLDVLVDGPGTEDDGTLASGPSTPTWHNGCTFEADKWIAPVQP